jgi:hypothetical protein
MPAGLVVGTTTGTQRLIFGAYYTGGTGSVCAIQSSDYYKPGATGSTGSIDHPQYLLLNPLGGNVGINNTTPSTALQVTGTVTATLFNTTSDYRIKDDIKTLDETDTVDGLKPVKYTNKLTNSTDIGLIAHELQELFPFLVNGEKDGPNHQSVNYTGLIGLLIKEIQNLKARVSKLEKIEK